MTEAAPLIEDDVQADEARALEAAVALADADPLRVEHEDMRLWMLRLAVGDFEELPPGSRGSEHELQTGE